MSSARRQVQSASTVVCEARARVWSKCHKSAISAPLDRRSHHVYGHIYSSTVGYSPVLTSIRSRGSAHAAIGVVDKKALRSMGGRALRRSWRSGHGSNPDGCGGSAPAGWLLHAERVADEHYSRRHDRSQRELPQHYLGRHHRELRFTDCRRLRAVHNADCRRPLSHYEATQASRVRFA